MDALAVHYYPITMGDWGQKLSQLYGTVNDAGSQAQLRALPVISPEMGYWSSGVSDESQQARRLVQMVQQALQPFPDLYFSGYTQDAIKEYAEASLTCAIIENQPLPTPEMLGTEYATYLNGLAEVPGELRRRCLDILRQGYSAEAERLLAWMDEIYALLITVDYPDAITYGLRRQTDLVRGIVERTRGDLTLSLREERLHRSMKALATMLPENGEDHAPD